MWGKTSICISSILHGFKDNSLNRHLNVDSHLHKRPFIINAFQNQSHNICTLQISKKTCPRFHILTCLPLENIKTEQNHYPQHNRRPVLHKMHRTAPILRTSHPGVKLPQYSSMHIRLRARFAPPTPPPPPLLHWQTRYSGDACMNVPGCATNKNMFAY